MNNTWVTVHAEQMIDSWIQMIWASIFVPTGEKRTLFFKKWRGEVSMKKKPFQPSLRCPKPPGSPLTPPSPPPAEGDSPFVVDAQTRQPRYGVALLQVFQANCTLPGVFTQDVLWGEREPVQDNETERLLWEQVLICRVATGIFCLKYVRLSTCI